VVVGGQFLANIHEGEVHESASGGAALLLGGGDQARADSGALTLRLHCQQPEVTSFAAQFDINATGQHILFEEHEEFSLLEKGGYFLRVGAIGVDEETLGAKGSIHQARDCGRVGSFGGADLRRSWQRLDFT
jgi:hypothetical protein